MKKLAGVLAACMVTLSIGGIFPTIANAEKIGVVVGENLTFGEGAEPVIMKDRVMLPLRAVSEALGASIYWFNEEKRIQIVLYDTLLSLEIENKFMGCYKIVNGSANLLKTVEMDVAATIHNDRTYVPVRAISEAFNADVKWDNQNRRAVIIPVEITKNRLSIAEANIQNGGTLCSVYGVIGRDEVTGVYYLRSLGRNAYGDYDKISLCTPEKTSLSDNTEYGEYISKYWLEQFGSENPSGLVVEYSGVIQIPEGDTNRYIVVNKTTTNIRSLGIYEEYMKSLGISVQ